MANPFDEFDSQPVASETTPVQNPFDTFDEYEDMPKEVKELEDGSWTDDPVMASRMLLEGLTFGWGDEIGAAVAAAAVKAGGDEKSYAQIYSEIKGSLQEEEKAYREANPTASIALNVIGGFGTGGLGTASKLGTVTKAAIGGGVAGAGVADQGDTLKGAATGAVFGAGVGSVFKGGGWLWDEGTKRRVANELGKGDKFVPIHLADGNEDETIGSFYRTVVGTSFGGGSNLKAQEAKIINPVRLRLGAVKEAYEKAKGNAKDALTTAKADINRVKADKIADISELKLNVRELGQESQRSIRDAFTSQKEKALMSATQQIDSSVKEAERAFRSQAILKSIPDGTPADVVDSILSSKTPNVAMQRLDEAWSKEGFKMLKDRKFQINSKSVSNEIAAKLKDDPLFAVMEKGGFQKTLDNVTSFIEDRTAKGWIDGEDLSAIRSRLGMLANQKSDAGGQAAVEQAIFKQMQDVLNDRVKSQLSGKSLKSFNAHTEGWKAHTTLRDAVTAASKKAGQGGEFTPDQWVSAIHKNSPRASRQGGGVLREEADDLAKLGLERDSHITKATDVIVKRAEKARDVDLKKSISSTKAEIAKLTREANSIRGKTGETAMTRRARNSSEIASKKQEIESLEKSLAALNNASTSGNATTFTRLAATYAFGAGNLITGSGLSKLASTQTAQRLIAGQTGVQQSLNNLGRSVGKPLTQGAANTTGLFTNPNAISDLYQPFDVNEELRQR